MHALGASQDHRVRRVALLGFFASEVELSQCAAVAGPGDGEGGGVDLPGGAFGVGTRRRLDDLVYRVGSRRAGKMPFPAQRVAAGHGVQEVVASAAGEVDVQLPAPAPGGHRAGRRGMGRALHGVAGHRVGVVQADVDPPAPIGMRVEKRSRQPDDTRMEEVDIERVVAAVRCGVDGDDDTGGAVADMRV